MSMVAAAIGGSAVLGFAGSAMGADAAGDAADKQAAAADRATQLQRDMYNQTRADQEPWRLAGASALSGLQDSDFQRDFTMNDFNADPGYNFRMQQGQQALERSRAAKGFLNSGGALKAISRYGQDYASGEYGNAYNRFNADRDRRFGRLSQIAGIGQTANAAVGAAGQNYADNSGSIGLGAAKAQGAAGIAQANQWGNALSGFGKAGMDYVSMKTQPSWMSQQISSYGSGAAPAAASGGYNLGYGGNYGF